MSTPPKGQLKHRFVSREALGRFTWGLEGGERIMYHDSPLYALATDTELQQWAASGKHKAVRNAAYLEINRRRKAKQ